MKTRINYCFTFLMILFIFSGCAKKEEDSPAPETGPTNATLSLNSPEQANFTFDGSNYAYNTSASDVSAFFTNNSSVTGFPDSSSTVFGAGIQKQIGSMGSSLIISKGTFKFLMPVDTGRLAAFFSPQSVPFSPQAANGTSIDFTDGSGGYWSTNYGSMDQTGSSLVINERAVSVINGEKYIKVRFTFNCKLYSPLGTMKPLTGGTAVMGFWTEY